MRSSEAECNAVVCLMESGWLGRADWAGCYTRDSVLEESDSFFFRLDRSAMRSTLQCLVETTETS